MNTLLDHRRDKPTTRTPKALKKLAQRYQNLLRDRYLFFGGQLVENQLLSLQKFQI
jgi:hypothetical protein